MNARREAQRGANKEAQRIAANIAKQPELVRRAPSKRRGRRTATPAARRLENGQWG